MIRGIRGANCVAENSKEAIFKATKELLREIIARNDIEAEQISSIFVTATVDLDADFPAYAVREGGFTYVPVLCAAEIAVPGAMKSLVRMLVNWETSKSQREIHHVYLGRAAQLRPDLAGDQPS